MLDRLVERKMVGDKLTRSASGTAEDEGRLAPPVLASAETQAAVVELSVLLLLAVLATAGETAATVLRQRFGPEEGLEINKDVCKDADHKALPDEETRGSIMDPVLMRCIERVLG